MEFGSSSVFLRLSLPFSFLPDPPVKADSFFCSKQENRVQPSHCQNWAVLAAETKVGQLQTQLKKKQKEVEEQRKEATKQRNEAEEQRRLVEILREQFRAGDSNNNKPLGAFRPTAQPTAVVPVQKKPAEAGPAPTEAARAQALAGISSEFSALIMSGIMTEFSALISSVQVPPPRAMNAAAPRLPSRIPTPAPRAFGPTVKPHKHLQGQDIRRPFHPYQAAGFSLNRQPTPRVLLPAVTRPAVPATKKASRSSLLNRYRAAAAARRDAEAKGMPNCLTWMLWHCTILAVIIEIKSGKSKNKNAIQIRISRKICFPKARPITLESIFFPNSC